MSLCVILHGRFGDTPDEADCRLQVEEIGAALRRLGFGTRELEITRDLAAAGEQLRLLAPDLVFNLAESIDGDETELSVAGTLCTQLGLPFTGSGPRAMRLTCDKPAAKALMRAAGLPTADWVEDAGAIADGDAGRWIVKAVAEHASKGLDRGSVVTGRAAVAARLAEMTARHGGDWFAERYIDGRDFAVSLLGPKGALQVLPPAEMVLAGFPDGYPKILDYGAKWHPGAPGYDSYRSFEYGPGDLGLLEVLKDLAARTAALFGLGGYVRVDFRIDPDHGPMLLEVNANPCLDPDAGYARTAAEAGIGYDQIIARIVAAAGVALPSPVLDAAAPPRHAPPRFRRGVRQSDVLAVTGLVAATGKFTPAEIDIAAELVDAALTDGEDASGYHFLFAEDEAGRLLGYTCHGPVAGAPGRYDLYWIAVDPGAQGRGVGRALMAALEPLLEPAEGLIQIYADTSSRPDYAPTRAFYRAAGFVRAAELPDFYRPGDGKTIFVRRIRA